MYENLAVKTDRREKLFFLTCIVITVTWTIVLSGRRIAFYDFNYITNAVHRMLVGQVPYRDFDLVLPPLTFLPVLAIHKYLSISIETAMFISSIMLQIFALVAVRSICRSLNIHNTNALLYRIALISVSFVNVISSYPNYIYDSVATTFALIAIASLLNYQITNQKIHLIFSCVSGLSCFYSKYNMGAFLILGIFLSQLVCLIRDKNWKKAASDLTILALFAMISVFLISGYGIKEYIEQTIIAPSKFKNVGKLSQLAQYNEPLLLIFFFLVILGATKSRYKIKIIHTFSATIGFGIMLNLFRILGVDFHSVRKLFPSVDFTYPVLMLFCLLILISSHRTLNQQESTLILLLPIYFFGTFASQGWNGSSYSLNPFLIILILIVIRSPENRFNSFYKALQIGIISIIFVVNLSVSFDGNRLSYVSDNGAREKSLSLERIGWASSKFDVDQIIDVQSNLMDFNNGETIVSFPAEDGLHRFSEKLTPWGRCLQFTFICPTKSDTDTILDFASAPPAIVVIKKNTQIYEGIESIKERILPILNLCFKKRFTNATYEVYEEQPATIACIRALEGLR